MLEKFLFIFLQGYERLSKTWRPWKEYELMKKQIKAFFVVERKYNINICEGERNGCSQRDGYDIEDFLLYKTYQQFHLQKLNNI